MNQNLATIFQSAIDQAAMRPIFESNLSQRSFGPMELVDLFVSRVFPDKGDRFTIQYILNWKRSGDSRQFSQIMCGYLYETEEGYSQDSTRKKGEAIVVENLRLIIPVFPYDPVLKNLAQLIDREYLLSLFSGIRRKESTGTDVIESIEPELVSYRLGRRAVLGYRIDRANRDAKNVCKYDYVAKLQKPSKIKKLLNLYDKIDRSEGATILPPVSYSDSRSGLIIYRGLPGKSLHDLICDSSLSEGCFEAGHLLRTLHGINIQDLPVRDRNSELESVRKTIGRVTPLISDDLCQSEKMLSALSSLSELSEKIGEDDYNSVIHGDFYDKQVLYDITRSSLLDLDSVSLGDPATDLGNFMAHIFLRSLQEPNGRNNVKKSIDRFWDGYQGHRVMLENRMSWWEAITCIRLAALYSLRPRWCHLAGDLLKRAKIQVGVLTNNLTGAQSGKRPASLN